MLTPDEVAAMLGLRGLGWGAKRIAAEFGCSRNTVRRYLGLGGWTRSRRPERAKALDGRAAGGPLPWTTWTSLPRHRHPPRGSVLRVAKGSFPGVA